MPKPTWEIAIDFEQDNEFSGADLITEDVLSCTWSLGFAGPYEPVAKDSQLTLTLRNTDKRYSPEYSRSPFYPNFTHGRLVRVRSTYNSVTRQHFIGWIDSIDPTPGKYGARQTVVRASGFLLKAQDYEAFVPVQEGKTADQVIDAVLRRAAVFPPGFFGRWTLGVATKGELGQNTTLGEITDYLQAETGISTFSIIGDQWSDGVTVYGALRDAVGREGGRLFVDRQGKIIFWNRNHLPLTTTVQATFDNAMTQVEYEFGDLFINKATVRARPRAVGTSNETLGVLNKATKIPAGESKEISFRYADTVNSGATVAGKNAVAPVQTTDFTANSMEDGSGTNYTSSVTAAIVEESGTRCKVRYTNAAGVDVWLQPGAVIRGIKITDFGEVDTERENSMSVLKFGLRPYTYPFVLDSVAEADNLAAFLLQNRQGPRGRVKALELAAYSSDALLSQALARTIGDRIVVIEEQTDINAAYFIIGESHRLTPNGDYRVVWQLEPAAVSSYWIFATAGYGEVGETTILA